MTIEAILDRLADWPTRLVEVTGGEPLLQPACPALLVRLADAGYTVMLETSGAADIGRVDPRVIRIVDLKCPGSGECDRNLWSNIELLRPTDEVKFVIADRADYEWAREVIQTYALADRCPILLSPVHNCCDRRELTEWMLSDGLPARLSLQIHKFIWSPQTRGV
jgi:7-carboxy-7-deazaguanine synthase